jgi:hypothetical protein
VNRPARRDPIAARLGAAGAVLGTAAGVVQATWGTHIPEWSGDKNDPVALGVLTVLLSGLAGAAAVRLRSSAPPSAGVRLAVLVGLAVPGLLCFTTVGRLWYLPGVLLISAAVLALAGSVREIAAYAQAHALRGLVSLLGGFELLMAVSARPVWLAAVGVGCGLALCVAPWLADRRMRAALIVAGAVPFAALTWWSIATPLLAIVALAVGAPVVLTAVRDS